MDVLRGHLPATMSEGLTAAQVRVQAAQGVVGGHQALPFARAIQQSFGDRHDLSGVRAHVGGGAALAAREIGAGAYTTGEDVAFARPPSLRMAAHEAAHVVQQRKGVRLADGVGGRGDFYERHADAVAERVVAGRSASSLLGPPAPSRSPGGAVQRDPPTETERVRAAVRRLGDELLVATALAALPPRMTLLKREVERELCERVPRLAEPLLVRLDGARLHAALEGGAQPIGLEALRTAVSDRLMRMRLEQIMAQAREADDIEAEARRLVSTRGYEPVDGLNENMAAGERERLVIATANQIRRNRAAARARNEVADRAIATIRGGTAGTIASWIVLARLDDMSQEQLLAILGLGQLADQGLIVAGGTAEARNVGIAGRWTAAERRVDASRPHLVPELRRGTVRVRDGNAPAPPSPSRVRAVDPQQPGDVSVRVPTTGPRGVSVGAPGRAPTSRRVVLTPDGASEVSVRVPTTAPVRTAQSFEMDIAEGVRRRALGNDPATRRYRANEEATALRVEAQLGITLTRFQPTARQPKGDWIDHSSGLVYDGCSPAPSAHFSRPQSWQSYQRSLTEHLASPSVDRVVVDVTGLGLIPEQISVLVTYLGSLSPAEQARVVRIGF